MAAFSSIGVFTFIRMSPPVPNYRRDFAFETRSGVDGNAIWDTGERGQTFVVQTYVDVATVAAARVLLELYQEAQRAAQPLNVVWSAIAEPRQVLIVSVEPINGTPRAIAGGVGGTYGGVARAVLEASWRLHTIYQ